MAYRHASRQWISQRLNATIARNPALSTNVFSHRKLPKSIHELPLSTYPNPLYGLSKKQLLELNIKELRHLVKIPSRVPSETDQFHKHIIEIFHEKLIKDTKSAVLYLDLIYEPLVRETVFEYLRHFYRQDSLRSSILKYIENPASPECRKALKANLHKILCDSREPPEIAASIALNYISKLALTSRVNTKPIFLTPEYSRRLYTALPKDQWSILFGALVQTNIKFTEYNHYSLVKSHLMNGSALDRFVARTGTIEPKWHDIEEPEVCPIQKRKMVLYFSLGELASYTQQAIRQKDVTSSNMYLELLVTKFEILNDPAQLQLVLSVMLSHSMAFKGPQECLKFLRYIMKSKLRVVPHTLLRILTALRIDHFYDEALLMINYLHTEDLSANERASLVAEIIKVITGKFSHEPKVAVGYFASLFTSKAVVNDTKKLSVSQFESVNGNESKTAPEGQNRSKIEPYNLNDFKSNNMNLMLSEQITENKLETDSDSEDALHLLKELMLLDLIYGPGSADDDSFPAIQKADVHQDLQHSSLTHACLRDMYMVTLRSLSIAQRTSPVLIGRLYERYTSQLDNARAKKSGKHTKVGSNSASKRDAFSERIYGAFNTKNVDESIVTLFLDQLLRDDAEARDGLDLVHDPFKFAFAKQMFNDFLDKHVTAGTIKNTYIFDLIISSSLLKHHDLSFALSAFKRARDLGLPITLNQVYPLIMHHYQKGEMKKAEQWFSLLMQSGAKAKSVAADHLFDIAREQKWAHTGTRYRNAVRRKSRVARLETEKLKSDPTAGFDLETTLGVSSHAAMDVNMGEELEWILHELATTKRGRRKDNREK